MQPNTTYTSIMIPVGWDHYLSDVLRNGPRRPLASIPKFNCGLLDLQVDDTQVLFLGPMFQVIPYPNQLRRRVIPLLPGCTAWSVISPFLGECLGGALYWKRLVMMPPKLGSALHVWSLPILLQFTTRNESGR